MITFQPICASLITLLCRPSSRDHHLCTLDGEYSSEVGCFSTLGSGDLNVRYVYHKLAKILQKELKYYETQGDVMVTLKQFC